jgi:hypothetical protein
MQSRAGGINLGRLAEDVQEAGKAGGRRESATGAREEMDGGGVETGGWEFLVLGFLACSRIVSLYREIRACGIAGPTVRC